MRYLIGLILLCCTAPALASGWNDYLLPISEDHAICRANSLDVMLCRDHSIILSPTDYPEVGPIVEYCVGTSHIFTRNIGRIPRNDFPGDIYEELDYSREFFFVVDRNTDEVSGPFTAAQFQADPNVIHAVPIQWKSPSNPNIVVPLLGMLMFLAYAAVILGSPLLIFLPVVIIVIYNVRRRKRERKAASDLPS